MRIQIIIPSWHHLADPFLHQPYWEMYLATNLQKKYNTSKISIIDLRKIVINLFLKFFSLD